MKLSEVPTDELIEAIRATEQAVGPDSTSLAALRRELDCRPELEDSNKPEAPTTPGVKQNSSSANKLNRGLTARRLRDHDK